MKCSKTFTIEIKMSEFYKFAKPLFSKKETNSFIKQELLHSIEGIFEGTYGGISIDWKEQFYLNLFKQGIIEQTPEGILQFGDFSLIS
jgi:hypothetical protein